MTIELTIDEKRLINRWQKGFPLVQRPYETVAAELGCSEENVLAMLASLQERGVLSRIGAVVKPNTVGASSLVAMKVPPHRLEEVAAIVCAIPEVNHNYEREDELNLWFVVTAADQPELKTIVRQLEEKTGLAAHLLPLQKAYHIDLGFSI